MKVVINRRTLLSMCVALLTFVLCCTHAFAAPITNLHIDTSQTVGGKLLVHLEWDDVPGADYYTIYRNNTIIETHVDSIYNWHYDNEAMHGIKYDYFVEAFNSDSVSLGSSNTVSINVPKVTSIDLSATINDNEVKLTWNFVTDADHYLVYKGGYYYKTLYQRDFMYSTNCYCYDENVVPGNTYTYRIIAVDVNSKEICRSDAANIEYASLSITAVGNTSKGVILYWTEVPGACSYSIWKRDRYTDDNPGSWDIDSVLVAENVKDRYYTISLSGHSSGNLYEYTVEAFDQDGNSICYDSYIKRYIGTTTMNAPTCTAKGIRVTWAKVEGAKQYVIFRSIGTGEPNWKYLTTVAATEDNIQVYNNNPPTGQSFTPGGWYAYTVRAIGEDNPFRTDDTCYGGQPSGRSVRYREPVKLKKLQSISSGVRATFTSVNAGYTYGLYRAEIINGKVGSYSLVSTVTNSSIGKEVWITDKTAVSGKQYSYYVRCLSKDKKTPLSSYANTIAIVYVSH